jgi:hypothetical protein
VVGNKVPVIGEHDCRLLDGAIGLQHKTFDGVRTTANVGGVDGARGDSL